MLGSRRLDVDPDLAILELGLGTADHAAQHQVVADVELEVGGELIEDRLVLVLPALGAQRDAAEGAGDGQLAVAVLGQR